MASDDNDVMGQQLRDDSHGETKRQSADEGDDASSHLTHSQRVERVNAYLRAAASKGIWSAIE
jgi:hypothetical protein